MPDPAYTQVFNLTDVVDALRDELLGLEKQLDRDEERLRFKLNAVEVELHVVVVEEKAKEGELRGKVGFKVPALAEAGIEAGGKATGSRSHGLTQTVRLKLTPVRITEDHARQRKEQGPDDDILTGGA